MEAVRSPLEFICGDGTRHDGHAGACQDACAAVSCCWTPYHKDSCAQAPICQHFLPCLYEHSQSNDVAVVAAPANEMMDAPASAVVTDNTTLASLSPLRLICDPKRVGDDPAARAFCERACDAGSCCTADPPNNCYLANRDVCDAYAACQAVAMLSIRPPPANISDICSEKRMGTYTGRKECEILCDPAACCLEAYRFVRDSCYKGNEDVCHKFGVCKILL